MPALSIPHRALGAPWALDRLLAARRFALADWPTPIDAIAPGGGPCVLVTRDDLSRWGRGGAKARKIEHLIGHMHALGRDELVTVVGNITNLAFDLLPALDRANIRASLYVIDDPPAPAEARERIFRSPSSTASARCSTA